MSDTTDNPLFYYIFGLSNINQIIFKFVVLSIKQAHFYRNLVLFYCTPLLSVPPMAWYETSLQHINESSTCSKGALDQGSRAAWIAEWRLRAQKLINLILKFYLYLSKENKERKLCQTSLDYCLRVCLSWGFVLTRSCVLTWVTKILMRNILGVHAGRRSTWSSCTLKKCYLVPNTYYLHERLASRALE